jgi:hypothetical protein
MPVSLVVINSWGPMGSSFLASLIEKWGYLNIPVRKSGLTDYLLGLRSIEDPYIQTEFFRKFEDAGLDVENRGSNIRGQYGKTQTRLIDFSLIEEELESLASKSFKRVADVYDAYRSLFSKAVIYKKIDSLPGRHIELVVDSSRFKGRNLCEHYLEHFDDVKFFHMTRSFDDWVESLASQYMGNPKRQTDFRFGQAKEEHEAYIESISELPGLRVDLEDLLIPNIKKTVGLISKELECRPIAKNLEQEEFDAYGKLMKFEIAFTKRDRRGHCFSLLSRLAIRGLSTRWLSRGISNHLFHPFYLAELAKSVARSKY